MPDVQPTIHDSGFPAEIDELERINKPSSCPTVLEEPIPRLPQELTDIIISHLAAEDIKTLAACALVGRSFLNYSRSLLFRTVSLTRFGTKLYELVASPHCSLVFRVRCLQLVMNRYQFMDISFLLSYLESVTYLSIDTVCPGFATHIPISPPTSAFALITVIKLRGIRFQSFNNIIILLCSFPALHSIILMGLSWEETIPPNSNRTLPSLLDTLHIYSNCGSFLEWIISASTSLPRLSTLIVGDVTDNDASTLHKFITAVGAALQHLSVAFQSDEEEAENIICSHPYLERIPQLRITRHRGMSIMRV